MTLSIGYGIQRDYPTFDGGNHIESLRTPSGRRGGSPAPEPPRPAGLCVPLRPVRRVLGVTACGMTATGLSREVSLVAAGLACLPVAGNPSPLARDSPL